MFASQTWTVVSVICRNSMFPVSSSCAVEVLVGVVVDPVDACVVVLTRDTATVKVIQ